MNSFRKYQIDTQEREELKLICRTLEIRDYCSLEKQCATALESTATGSIQREVVLRFLRVVSKAWSDAGTLTCADQDELIECARGGHWLSRATIIRRYLLSPIHWTPKLEVQELLSWFNEAQEQNISWLEVFVSRAPWCGRHVAIPQLRLSGASIMLSAIPVASLRCYLKILEDAIYSACFGEDDLPVWLGCCELIPGVFAGCTVTQGNSERVLELRWSHAYGDMALTQWPASEAGWLEHFVHLRGAVISYTQDSWPSFSQIFHFA